ncbi:MAG: fumarylacetoacetate hydrolase family protein, partial [Tardiphaga sp.]
MKLVRYGDFGHEKPGLIDQAGKLRDLSGHIKDLADDAFTPANLAKLAALDPATLPEVSGSPRFGSPIGGKPKFIAIGLNYADHAAESGMPIPSEPIVFMKALNSLCGPNDDVEKPRGSTKLDWEVELAIIIGTKAK